MGRGGPFVRCCPVSWREAKGARYERKEIFTTTTALSTCSPRDPRHDTATESAVLLGNQRESRIPVKRAWGVV